MVEIKRIAHILSPKESNKILMATLKERGMSVDEVLTLEKEKGLWFAGRGIIGILIRKMGFGYVSFDKRTSKFSAKI